MDSTREEQVMKLTVIAVAGAVFFAVAPQVAAGGNVAQVKPQISAQVVTIERADAARAVVQRADIQRAVVQRADTQRAVVQRADIQRARLARLGIHRLR